MIKIEEDHLSSIASEYCSCGGRGPNDNPCPACAMYHHLIRLQQINAAGQQSAGVINECPVCGGDEVLANPEFSQKNKPTVPDVLPIVRAYYSKPGNSVGGSLHIVLDDGNVEDSSVEFCKKYAAENNDIEGVVLADVLLEMSKTQRKKLYMSRKRL